MSGLSPLVFVAADRPPVHGQWSSDIKEMSMRVFMTGATGFIGSYLVPELIRVGHHVLGMSRSDAGVEALERAGAEVFRGDLNDLDRLRAGAESADGVIHLAFNHDFAKLVQHSAEEQRAIEALGETLLGSVRPLVVASGTGLVDRAKISGPAAAETDAAFTAAAFPRAAIEEAADSLVGQGGHVVVMRLAQVHDTAHAGRIAQHIKLAREKQWVAYVGAGENRLAAAHVSDVVRLFRLALEHGRAGARYHAVAEEGVPFREIADVIGAGLGMPVRSIAPEDVADYFGPIARIAAADMVASSAITRHELNWAPTGPGLLDDLRRMDFSTG